MAKRVVGKKKAARPKTAARPARKASVAAAARPGAMPAATQAPNPLRGLLGYGQSVWLDFIRRNLLKTGELKRLIAVDGLRGVTSNPSIFEKAIAGSTDYKDALAKLERQKDSEPMALYEQLAIKDIQDAADTLKPVYLESKKRDGYVSLEVSPYLAHETKETIDEARRLWKAVKRPNVMIKVPGTAEGIPAIRTLISEAINVNVTLLFAQSNYERVADAYIGGLAERAKKGLPLSGVASVASFFVSRIDTLIDGILAERIKGAKDPQEQAVLQSLLGKVAIANARLVYQKYKEICRSEQWRALANKKAQTQRLLWASTSTKNPNYRDVLYVEELIGPDTVDTIPPATFDAFRDHGKLRASLESDLEEAHDTMKTLADVGISMKDATDQLQTEAVKLFAEAFDKLLDAVDKGRKAELKSEIDRLSFKLPADLESKVKSTLDEWRAGGKVRRLWGRDASLWTGSDEADWLGWLGVADDQLAHIAHLKSIAEDARKGGFTHALLLGMGGSSLCPEVMAETFGKVAGYPELLVLDSTDPARIRALERQIDYPRTLFIVSSKSGSTLEPNIFKQYFLARAKEVLGAAEAPKHFIAITDPDSKLEQVVRSEGFRAIFNGVKSIGGRYSALSDFGMVPAAVMGVDIARFLDSTEVMLHSCRPSVPPEDNPGAVLGAIMGVLANNGRDKVTIIASPMIADLGAWIEQLLAESTGKVGKGLIPVDSEQLGTPEVYGKDRLFVYVRLDHGADAKQDAAVAALEAAGQAVVRIELADIYDLGQEFFRWEFATAVAGSIIGINAFNQPDVEASKIATRKLTSEYEVKGALPPEEPIFEGEGVKLYADAQNTAALRKSAAERSLLGYLKAHFGRIKAGDYFAMLAYVEMSDANRRELQGLRQTMRDRKRVATCLGFGPRFLHSTGQAYKGGPNSGVFLQITCDDAADLAVPGQKYTFGTVKAAQARGDFQVLAERNRRALRVHLGADVAAGLETLQRAVQQALA
ncbi:MAG TPA: bifunctional transaldolase/phosoglucose isomerase [Candidatus Binataceae bacterium]|nr:bifunctional transaldolase/phosoglucose isomerase [Candidatus Binataceae bacterium]